MKPILRRRLFLLPALLLAGAGVGVAFAPETGTAWPACANMICTADHTSCFPTDAGTYCSWKYGPGFVLECWSQYCPVH